MNMQMDTWTTRQKENVFALSIEGKQEKEYNNEQCNLGSAKIVCQAYYTHPWYIRLLWFKLLFGNRGVTHLIREQLLPGSPGSVEEAKIPTSLGSAAQALDGVESG
jgi:hypothetical protein